MENASGSERGVLTEFLEAIVVEFRKAALTFDRAVFFFFKSILDLQL